MVPPWDCRFVVPFDVLLFGGPAMLQSIGPFNAATCDYFQVLGHFCEFSVNVGLPWFRRAARLKWFFWGILPSPQNSTFAGCCCPLGSATSKEIGQFGSLNCSD